LEIYPFIDVLTPNEREAGDLAGMEVITIDEAKEAASILCSRGCGAVVVTLGAQGALLRAGDTVRHFPPFSVSAIDSVGAGDAFNGALAAALNEGKSISQAVAFANAAGARSTIKRGAQEALPTKEEIQQLLLSGQIQNE
jgi:ribokinase